MLGWLKKWLAGPAVDFPGLMKKGAIIVDVRSVAEYKSGHIPGSRNIPLETIRHKTADLKKTGKPVITVCKSGARSSIAKGILRSAGIEVFNGGSWNQLQRRL